MSRNEYDLIVIGSGPGGQRAAVLAAKVGKRVIVVEKGAVGGACLHKGTIPSKTLREAALGSLHSHSLEAVLMRAQSVIHAEAEVISRQLSRNKIEYVTGVGSFVSPHEIRIKGPAGEKTVKGSIIVIATGTRPRHSPDMEFDGVCIFDSDTILEIPEQPVTLAVVGGGVIGCEYASIFASMGVGVTLIDQRSDLLPAIDKEIVGALIKQFQKYRIDLRLGSTVADIQCCRRPDGKKGVLMKINGREEAFDALLFCMGRIGNTEDLQLENAGLRADERGLLTVDRNYQTPVPHIYAVGDVIGPPALAASSAEQGRLAATHAFCDEEASFPDTFPYGIYTIPEISSVGAQEAELTRDGVPYIVGRALYKELARGKIIDDEHGFLKLLVHSKTEKILGVHVIGTGATELVHIGQTAMAFGATVGFFVNNVFNYPTLAEAYKVAAFSALNQLRFNHNGEPRGRP